MVCHFDTNGRKNCAEFGKGCGLKNIGLKKISVDDGVSYVACWGELAWFLLL